MWLFTLRIKFWIRYNKYLIGKGNIDLFESNICWSTFHPNAQQWLRYMKYLAGNFFHSTFILYALKLTNIFQSITVRNMICKRQNIPRNFSFKIWWWNAERVFERIWFFGPSFSITETNCRKKFNAIEKEKDGKGRR